MQKTFLGRMAYFKVFERKQNPTGSYAAVIPLFVKKFMNHESSLINGDGTFSRHFSYIVNVFKMNLLCITTENESALNHIYNTAVGDRSTLV